MRTPERGASTVVYLASSPEVEGITARYWANLKPKPSSKRSYDVEAGAAPVDDQRGPDRAPGRAVMGSPPEYPTAVWELPDGSGRVHPLLSQRSRSRSAIRSAMAITARWVFARGMVGMIEASAT